LKGGRAETVTFRSFGAKTNHLEYLVGKNKTSDFMVMFNFLFV